jgi:hypothetical protein
MEQTKINRPRKNWALISLLIIILTGMAFAVFLFKGKDLSLNEVILMIKNYIVSTTHSKSSDATISYEVNSHSLLIPYGKGFIIVDNNGIQSYNIKGEQEWKEDLIISNPLVKTSRRYLVIADLTSNNIYFFRGKARLWSKIVEGNILNISVNDSGYLGLIYKDTSYKSVVEVFDSKGICILQRYYSNNYAIDAQVSSDARNVAVGEVDVSGFSMNSGVRFINTDTQKDTFISEDNSIISDIAFWDKNVIVCLDKQVLCIDKDHNKTVINDFSNDRVTDVALNRNRYIIKVQKNSNIPNASSLICIIDKKGKTIGSYSARSNLVNIDSKGDTIGLNFGNKVIFINEFGKEIGQFEPKKDAKEIKLTTDGIYAAIIYRDSIDIINVFQ